jgi:hypothetical protein
VLVLLPAGKCPVTNTLLQMSCLNIGTDGRENHRSSATVSNCCRANTLVFVRILLVWRLCSSNGSACPNMTRNLYYRIAGCMIMIKTICFSLKSAYQQVTYMSDISIQNSYLQFLSKDETIHVKSVSCVQNVLVLHERRGECHSSEYVIP